MDCTNNDVFELGFAVFALCIACFSLGFALAMDMSKR